MPPAQSGGVFTWWRRLARWQQDVILLAVFGGGVLTIFRSVTSHHGPWPTFGESNTLAAGQSLPQFSFVSVSGDRVESQQLRGNWSLLYFTQPSCPACDYDLGQLQTLAGEPPFNSLQIWVFLVGDTREGVSPDKAASAYSREIAPRLRCSPMPRSVYNQLADHLTLGQAGEPFPPPFCVLVDPENRVRFVYHDIVLPEGIEVSLFGLVQALQSEADPSWFSAPEPLEEDDDEWVELLSGERRSLRDLSHDCNVLLTIVDADSTVRGAWRRVREMLRYGRNRPGLVFVFVWLDGRIPEFHRQFGDLFSSSNILQARRIGGALLSQVAPSAAYRTPSLRFLPATALIRNGQILLRDKSIQRRNDLQWAVTLAAVDFQLSGK